MPRITELGAADLTGLAADLLSALVAAGVYSSADVALAAIVDGVTPAANRMIYFTSGTAASGTPLTAAARNLLDDSDSATMRRTLGTIGNQDGVCSTIDARNITSTPAFPGASRCYYVRMTGALTSTSALEVYIGTSSGNISVGLVGSNGSSGTAAQPSGARKATSGTVACPPGNSFTSVALTTSPAVAEGDYGAITADNTTVTVGRSAAMVASGGGISYFEAAAHPVPASVGALTVATHPFYLAAY